MLNTNTILYTNPARPLWIDFLDSNSYVVLVKDDIYGIQKFLNSGTSHVWSKHFAQDLLGEPIIKVVDNRMYIFVQNTS